MQDASEQQDYEQALVEYIILESQFAMLEHNGFKEEFPEQFKAGLLQLSELEETLYFWRRRIQLQENIILNN